MALCGERALEADMELSKDKDYGMNEYDTRIWNEFNRLRVKLGAAQVCNAGFCGICGKS
jgi:hypothetical protein